MADQSADLWGIHWAAKKAHTTAASWARWTAVSWDNLKASPMAGCSGCPWAARMASYWAGTKEPLMAEHWGLSSVAKTGDVTAELWVFRWAASTAWHWGYHWAGQMVAH